MNTKSKILLGGFTLIGAGGVATFSLSRGFGSFKGIEVLKLPRGGHSLVKSPSLSGGKKLDLQAVAPEKESLSLFSQSISLPKVKLDLENHSPNQLDISYFEQGSSTNENIQKVKREIGAAEELGGIEGEVTEKYIEVLQRYFNGDETIERHINNIQDVRNKVRKWHPTQRGSDEIIYLLGQEKRKSLQKIYRLYRRLTSEKNKFSHNLDSLVKAKRNNTKSSASQHPLPEDLSNVLKQINWSGKQIRLTKNGKVEQECYRNDWGSWDNNPFNKFYTNQEEFQNDLNSINSLTEELRRQKKIIDHEYAMFGDWRRADETLKYKKWKVEKRLENSKFPIEFKIAQKILEKMKK